MSRRKKLNTVGKPPAKPEGAGILTTYDQLREKARKFAEGKYNLLVIAGGPGLSKSTTFKRALEAVVGDDYCLIEANASAFGAYCKLWRKRNQLALLDDAEPIIEQPGGKRLLKQIGQTDQWKHCSWESKATMGKNAVAPQEFWTSSKVCIITNSWEYRQGNIHTAAVEDRGQCWVFMPTAMEIHRFVSEWFWDQEVFDFVGQHLPYLRSPSVRLYRKAWEMKQAGDDWKAYILDHIYEADDLERIVLDLMYDNSFADNTQRCLEFQRRGCGSRATFYRYLADMKERHDLKCIPYLKAQGKPPEDQPDPMGEEQSDEEASEEGDDEDD
jgi:hypothetical protein